MKKFTAAIAILISIFQTIPTSYAQLGMGEATTDLALIDNCQNMALNLLDKEEFEHHRVHINITPEIKIDLMRASIAVLMGIAGVHASLTIDHMAFETTTLSVVRSHYLKRSKLAFQQAYGEMSFEKWNYLYDQDTRTLGNEMRRYEEAARVPESQLARADAKLSRLKVTGSLTRTSAFLVLSAIVSKNFMDLALNAVYVENKDFTPESLSQYEDKLSDTPDEQFYEVLAEESPEAAHYRGLLLNFCLASVDHLMSPPSQPTLVTVKD